MNNKVVTSKPDWDLIFASLINLSDKSANAVIRAALEEFSGITLKWGDYGPFCNQVIQEKLLAIITNVDGTPMIETD